MIQRFLLTELLEKLHNSTKIILIYGARQVGKTTLVKQLLSQVSYKSLSINADEEKYNDVFSSRDLTKMRMLTDGYELLFIDEAQRIPDIGINLKILHDALPELKIIATGSSSFELANRTQESLTGRTWTFSLFPISFSELRQQQNLFELNHGLETFLRFGAYPDVFSLPNQADKVQFLTQLTRSYLYKDILELSTIKHPDKIKKLLQLLAFQAGSEVSLNELGNTLQMSKDTVASYIDLLEKAFIVFRLSGFSRNLRKEVVKMDKIYFYDLGVRNALVNNFNTLDFRTDAGQLWENFLVVERLKNNAYQRRFVNSYFWRTYTGAELDYIEEADGQLAGFEFKFSDKTAKPPQSWLEAYPNSDFKCINRANYWEFI